MKRILLIAIASLLLAGCAAVPSYNDFITHPQVLYPSPAPGKALIYFYQENYVGGALYYIRQGDKIIGATGPQGYFFLEFEPGEQCFWAEVTDGFSDVRRYSCVKVETDKTYYMATSWESGSFYLHPAFQSVPEDIGRAAVRNLKYTTLR